MTNDGSAHGPDEGRQNSFNDEREQYESFLRHEVPRRVRRHLQTVLDDRRQGEVFAGEAIQLAEIVRDCLDEVIHDFRLGHRHDAEHVEVEPGDHDGPPANLVTQQMTEMDVSNEVRIEDWIEEERLIESHPANEANFWRLGRDDPNAWTRTREQRMPSPAQPWIFEDGLLAGVGRVFDDPPGNDLSADSEATHTLEMVSSKPVSQIPYRTTLALNSDTDYLA